MDIDLLFPEKYLKGDDFINREVTLTIRNVIQDDLFIPSAGKKQPKAVVFFEELHAKAEAIGRVDDQKRIIISKTLKLDIVTLFGKETKAWHGKRLTLYRGPAVAGGKMVIRARLATTPSDTSTSTTEPNQ